LETRFLLFHFCDVNEQAVFIFFLKLSLMLRKGCDNHFHMLKQVKVPSQIDGINAQLKPIVRNCILNIAGDAVAEVIF